MKIHFIKTPDTREIYPSLGFSYIMSELIHKRLEVEFIDTNLIDYPYDLLRKNPRKSIQVEPNWEKIKSVLEKKDVQYAFLTGSFTKYIHNTAKTAEILKKINSDCVTIVGGVHVSFLPEETLKMFENIDYVIIGEGERVSENLLYNLIKNKDIDGLSSLAYKIDGKVVINEREYLENDIDNFNYPAKSLWPVSEYREIWKYLWSGRDPLGIVMTSRGCIGKCIFCASGRKEILENRLRFRSFENIKGEIEYLIKTFKITSLDFIDDCFTCDKDRLLKICSYLKKKNIPWLCKSRVDTVSYETLTEMKESGCRSVFLGVESADDKVLKTMGKGTNLDEIKKCFQLFQDIGLEFTASFTIGHPNEDKESMEKTICLAKSIAKKGIGVGFYLITPYPGTALYDMSVQNGWLYSQDWKLFDQLNKNNSVYAPEGWTPRELTKFYRSAWYRIDRAHIVGKLFSASYIGATLKKLKSLQEIQILFSTFVNVVKRSILRRSS